VAKSIAREDLSAKHDEETDQDAGDGDGRPCEEGVTHERMGEHRRRPDEEQSHQLSAP
jgi:hypothetical protein